MSNICVVGLGYVGLPLVINAAKKGIILNGFDIDSSKVESLISGECYIKEYRGAFKSLYRMGQKFSCDPNALRDYDEIIICVPTPVSESRLPDHSFVDSVIDGLIAVGHLPSLVVLESTVAPGYTRLGVVKKLESAFGVKCGSDFHVCFSPEREDPGNKKYMNIKIPKVLGGFSDACFDRCLQTYASIFESVVRASSLETAELTKLHENTFRAVNIAYVNQLRDLTATIDIDIREVIDLASSKPFGFSRFEPSNGVGGHCIPVDPYFLLDKFGGDNLVHHSMKYIEDIPDKTFQWIESVSSPNDSFVMVGLGYKDGVDDLRNSPNLDLMGLLKGRYGVLYYDPNFESIDIEGFAGVSFEQVISGQHQILISNDSGEALVRDNNIMNYLDLRYWRKYSGD